MNKLFNINIQFTASAEIGIKMLASVMFILISYIAFNFHEPWRDELQAFSLVKNTSTINDLIKLVRYEGHPLGWYILQKCCFLFSPSFLLIRYIHWALLSIGVLLFLWQSPFPIIYKIAIIFGYFFTYEYGAIARNYGIAIPFYILLCMWFNTKKHYLFGLLILITMQFSLYSFIIAFSTAIMYFYVHASKKNTSFILGIIFSIIGIILFRYVVNPPADVGTSPGWKLNPDNYTAAFSVIANAFLPIFLFNIHFWNSTILETFLSYNFAQAVQFLISIILFAWIIKILSKNKIGLYLFLVGSALMMFFIAAKYHGSIRHHGHIYILLLMAIWISKINFINIALPFNLSAKTKKIILFFPDKHISKMFFVIILSQLIGTFQSIYFEIKYPFSASKQAANFIQKNYSNQEIIACNDDACTSVAILMNKKIYQANTNAYREHLIFNSERGDITYETLIYRTNQFFLKYPKGILLISKSNSISDYISRLPYKLVYSTSEAIRHDEAYLIYTKN